MRFVFKRDKEGRERIYVGDVCVAESWEDAPFNINSSRGYNPCEQVLGVYSEHIDDAIERADEAGFWEACDTCQGYDCGRRYDVVTVEVPSC